MRNKSIPVMRLSENRHGLGREHPLCDRIQILMIILFFIVWSIDSISHIKGGYSTIVFGSVFLPARLVLFAVFIGLGCYLVLQSHRLVFREGNGHPGLFDSGVYGQVRHPMYLGILLFCLAFLFVLTSLVSIGIWIVFFVAYDRMAAYEEKSLTETLGDDYTAYQKRVPKWFPRLISRQRAATGEKRDTLKSEGVK